MRMLKKNMFRAVLFLLLTVLMVAWVSTAVIAGGDPTRSLSLTFDDANILSCTLTVKDRHSGTVVEGFNNKPIVSGEVYQISVGNDVTVTVSTGMGYKVTVQDATGDVNVNKNGLSWNLHWDNYTEEFSATLGTTPRTYKVNVLDYDQEGDISYYIADSSKADGWTIDDLNDPNAPFTYTYGDSTELPSVQRTGFIFEGWRVVGGNLSDVRKIDGKYYIHPGDCRTTESARRKEPLRECQRSGVLAEATSEIRARRCLECPPARAVTLWVQTSGCKRSAGTAESFCNPRGSAAPRGLQNDGERPPKAARAGIRR